MESGSALLFGDRHVALEVVEAGGLLDEVQRLVIARNLMKEAAELEYLKEYFPIPEGQR